jgi:methylmalonyl-CoA/ethylmalonyl-CoA epimerase
MSSHIFLWHFFSITIEPGKNMLNNLKPHHISISVPDMEESITFWTNTFGFVLEHRATIEAIPGKLAFLENNGFRIELWEVEGAQPVPESRKEPDSDLRTNGTKHIAFQVPDVQEALDELVKRGVDIAAVQRDFTKPMIHEQDPSMDANRSKQPAVAAFIRDPAGTLIELIAPEKTNYA